MKKAKKMPVECTSVGAQQKTAVIEERSLDLINSPGCYSAKIKHTSSDVGLPLGFCSNEHYITATLIVTESGTDDELQRNRLIGQTLIMPDCNDGLTRIFTRAQKKINEDYVWSDWCIIAQSGIDDKITNTGDIISKVTRLMSETKEIKTDLSSETARTKEAEAAITEDAILSGSLNVNQDTDNVTIAYRNINGTEASEINITAATTENAGVMSAEDKKALSGIINETYSKEILLTEGYYNFKDLAVGDIAPSSATYLENKMTSVIKVFNGQKLNLKTYVTSGNRGYSYPWVVTDTDKVIQELPKAENTFDLTKGIEIEINKDGFIYVCCNNDYLDVFCLSIKGNFIDKQMENTERINDISESVVKNSSLLSILYTDEKRVFTEMDFALGFYNVQGKAVGDIFDSTLKSSTTKYASSIEVASGAKIVLHTYSTSANQGATRPWVMVNTNGIIIAICESLYTYDYTNGVEIDVPQNATLYVACDVGYEDVFSLEISGGIVDELRDKAERLVDTSETLKTTNSPSLYLPNKTVLLSGASISDKVGYFEYAMKKLGLTGTNVSAAGKNISYLCYLLYSNTYRNHDVLIISHLHNFDVYSLPASVENYSAAEYEADEVLAPYVTTRDYREGTIVPPDGYTVDEMYAICYDYAIKKWMERCYNLRTTEGYDSLAGKNCQIVLMTHWHDARTVYNSAIRKLAKKWGLPLIKEDENIGFSKNRVHPVTGEQWSVLYCNGVPYSGKTEVINDVTYGFHPSGIATENWDTFANADAETMLQMLPDIQRRRAAIMMSFFKDSITNKEV